MEIRQILSRRNRSGQNYAQSIIYEWEDVIAEELKVPAVPLPSYHKVINHFHIHTPLAGPFRDSFRFVINGKDEDAPMNSRHVIPCIIDFFEREDQLQAFYRKHDKNKLVLFSSPFDYQYLKERNCPLNIGLFAYSLPDRYALTGQITEKKYDIVLAGRQDPLLYAFFKEYVKRHPEVTYVKRGTDLENDASKTAAYYVNGRDCLGSIETREEFMQLQAQGRVTLYGVQGYMPGSTSGFYHMTPHFLEIIACACHVIAHYPSGKDGVDAQFYEFDRFSPSVETYEAFEAAMDTALSTDVDRDEYASYLKKHFTSCRVRELQKILDTL
jgi:hypothetical protein